MRLLALCLVLLMPLPVGCGEAAHPAGDRGDPLGDGDGAAQATARVFADFTDETPGCAVAVAHPDGIHSDAFGMADLDAGQPVTPETIFDLGSVSKQITAGAIALLVLHGDLDPAEDVREILPDLALIDVPVTVADLVHHTSGLPDYVDALDAELEDVTTTADALAVIAHPDARPRFHPGTEFEYSNTNYLLLAEVVREVTGESLVDFAHQEIFDPLGMARSRYRDDQGTLDPGQAQGYEVDGQGYAPVASAWRQTGDGAVHSTVVDLLAWARLFLDEPRSAGLGSPEWLAAMRAPGEVPDAEGTSYAGGIELHDTDLGLRLTHGGSWIGYSSVLHVVPEADLAVAVACNIDGLDAEGLGEDVLSIWADAS